MLAIPVDVLRDILEHVDKIDLATICRVNKICCSWSQNVLYREIYNGDKRVIQTLAQSTDLARRVRSFETDCDCDELATALQNMSSLRRLNLECNNADTSVLDGCTFKLDSFASTFPYDESLRNFLNSQPGLTDLRLDSRLKDSSVRFNETCLPNLTQIRAHLSWLHSKMLSAPSPS